MVERIFATTSTQSQVETTFPNLQPGDVAIIKEDVFVPPNHWPMALIISTSPGRDGHTKVVTLKTKSCVCISVQLTSWCYWFPQNES